MYQQLTHNQCAYRDDFQSLYARLVNKEKNKTVPPSKFLNGRQRLIIFVSL